MAAVPAPIQRMVDTTNAGDTAGFLDCFTTDAFLSDWGRDFSGQDGIASWNTTDNIGVKSKLRVVSVTPEGGAYRVKVAVSGGGFNGEGTMTFTLAGDRIARLIIS
jgi:hypothetical protein